MIAPTGVRTTLSYAATPATVCTVDSSTGELTIQGAGTCDDHRHRGVGTDNYNAASVDFHRHAWSRRGGSN